VPPRAYVITRRHEAVARVLALHGITFLRAYRPVSVPAEAQYVTGLEALALRMSGASARYRAMPTAATLAVQPGDLVVPLFQENPALITLLLEPSSMAALFTTPAFHATLTTNAPAYVYHVDDYLQIPSFTTRSETLP
jgi:hypothetical protein